MGEWEPSIFENKNVKKWELKKEWQTGAQKNSSWKKKGAVCKKREGKKRNTYSLLKRMPWQYGFFKQTSNTIKTKWMSDGGDVR